MSLKIWLPLDGNLENKGCSNVTITNSGAIVNSSGKIGSCYHFGTSSSYMTIPASTMTGFTTECSVAFWLKVKTWNTSYATFFQAGLGNSSWAHYIFGFLRNNANSTVCFTISNGSTASNASYLTSALSLNTWYHVALTYETGKCKIYLNGALDNEYTTSIVPNFASITKITIGTSNATGSYQTDCDINDFRIYDHCLSAAEVKDISQALVCHAKLDEGNKNLLNSFYKAYTPTAYNAYQLSMTENMVSGGTYTLQLWDVTVSHSAKADSALGVWVYWGGGSVSLCSWSGSDFVNGHANYLVKTITISSSQASGSGATNLWLNLYNSVPNVSGTMNMKIGGWKLEKGSVATQYTNASDTTIHDSSGYGHNGTVTGAPTYVSDTVRNNTSLRFTATSHKCVLSNLNTSAFSNSYSIAWWGKCASFSGLMQWGFSDGIRLNGIYNGTLWNTGDGSNNPLYTPGTTTQVAAPTTGAWHHFVMTGDGTTCKVYKDGVHWATAKTYKAINGSTIYLNGWDSSTSYSNSDLYLSDFRIYATVLSAEDVKELYEVSYKIDNKDNIHGFNFDESGASIVLSKNTATVSSLSELDVLSTLKYDTNTYIEPDGSVWVRIFHHANPASKLFSSGNTFANSCYVDADRWFNFQPCNDSDKWELMIKQKAENTTAAETKWRWVQTKNPLTAAFADVAASTVTYNTTNGYSSTTYGGLYHHGSNTYLCANNGTSGNWWGAVGAWSQHQSGIPAWSGVIVKTGYEDVYLRIDNLTQSNILNVSFKKSNAILAKQFIEV